MPGSLLPSLVSPAPIPPVSCLDHPYSYPRIPPIPSATQVTPQRPSLSSAPNSKPPTTQLIVFLLVRYHRFTRSGNGARQLSHARHIRQASLFPSANHRLSGLSGSPTFRPRFPVDDELSLTICDIWASMVNTLLLPIFQKPSTANNNATSHAQTAKLNDTLAWAGGSADGKG